MQNSKYLHSSTIDSLLLHSPITEEKRSFSADFRLFAFLDYPSFHRNSVLHPTPLAANEDMMKDNRQQLPENVFPLPLSEPELTLTPQGKAKLVELVRLLAVISAREYYDEQMSNRRKTIS